MKKSTSTSQLISPMLVNRAPPSVCARSRAALSCSFVMSRGKEGDQPAPFSRSVRYGATCAALLLLFDQGMDGTHGLRECGAVGLGVGVVVFAVVCTTVEPDEVVLRKGMDEIYLCF